MKSGHAACVAGLGALTLMLGAEAPALAQDSGWYQPAYQQGYAQQYTLNGEVLTGEDAQLFMMLGLPFGDYYATDAGDFGLVGQPPLFNLFELETMMSDPNAMAGGGFGQQPGYGTSAGGSGLEGTRIFWVYSPSMFSGASGGASGYIHLCPGGVFHRSSEGSISVGGEYNSAAGMNNSWAGMAQTSAGAGQWTVSGGTVTLRDHDGGQQQISVSAIQGGSWKIGQHSYGAERGRASCR